MQPDPSKNCGPYHLPADALLHPTAAHVAGLAALSAQGQQIRDGGAPLQLAATVPGDFTGSAAEEQTSDIPSIAPDSKIDDAHWAAEDSAHLQGPLTSRWPLITDRDAHAAPLQLGRAGRKLWTAVSVNSGMAAAAKQAEAHSEPLLQVLATDELLHAGAEGGPMAVQRAKQSDQISRHTANGHASTARRMQASDERSQRGSSGAATPSRRLPRTDEYNHDTIAMVAIDAEGRIAAGASSNGANHKVHR